ncbi:ComF family protein [Legionella septentrionalis]|uniref:ComF family protein n=1 Tax=Legionella septentrionalis TaxID=2498109 RepID=UPI000F8EEF0F|nr:ComF family protein [Legionella septentrionalis]RUR10212.1 ComF family protein [Legionella septentrionalis]
MQKRKSITQILRLPSICTLCNHYHYGAFAVCNDCIKLLQPIKQACQLCALPLQGEDTFLICGYCCKQKPYFDEAVAAYHFEEPLRTLLHEFKYREGLYLATLFTELMLEKIPRRMTDSQCLLPVPMSTARLRMRGFNQAVELTKRLSKRLQIPYKLDLCRKIKETAAQASLNSKQRQKNIRGAFMVKAIQYKHVTLVDDLLTTGSTANELARALKKQGVEQVDVWCCARAVLN